MDHHISVIHQDPVSGLVSFHLLWFYSGSAQFFTDTVRHSLNLVPVGSAGDDKIVCQSGNFFNINDGIVNQFITKLGGQPVDFMGTSKYFRTLYVFSGAWQTAGFDAIVFSAAIAGVDPGLYEAAYVDGSTRVKNIYLITLPCILPTIIIMLILRVGNLMSVGFEKVILMYSERIYDTADVLSTYSYRAGIIDNKWSYSSAIGMMNSIVNLCLIIGANALSRKVSDTSLW